MTAPALFLEAPVFLCHARPDLPFVRVLAAYLRAHGLAPWLDVEDLPSGEDWQPAIERVLSDASLCVACLSRHSAASRWTSFELDLAVAKRVPIAPVLAGAGATDAAPPILEALPAIDVGAMPVEQGAFFAAQQIAARVPGSPGLDLACAIHERWRTARRISGLGTRWRTLAPEDREWLRNASADVVRATSSEVDLLQLAFRRLPPSIIAEVRAAAADASAMVLAMPDAPLEELARRVHAAWTMRNGKRAEAALLRPYDELVEEEKEKDRIVVRTTALALGLAVA